MKVTLSFENTISKDISIVVDALRASTTITAGLNNFNEIIPCFSPEEAFKIHAKNKGILAGERNGIRIDGFNLGNSPELVEKYEIQNNDSKILILTTSNGTRIMKNMNSTVLIGSFINAKAVAKSALKMGANHIDVVMAGVKGKFAIEDFLASGEILYWIKKELNNKGKYTISEEAESAILARQDYEKLKEAVYNSHSGKGLEKLGFKNDVDYCLNINTTNNVGIYEKGIIKLLKQN
ncbi:2-phosphosulfolactate phosphatase [Methanobrevibacter sp. OttesenSCG-928-K11]|nr:2-phosphosulfolactate phosphatase [Methanobrevibacter sp. OttesenSCG-928-K11]